MTDCTPLNPNLAAGVGQRYPEPHRHSARRLLLGPGVCRAKEECGQRREGILGKPGGRRGQRRHGWHQPRLGGRAGAGSSRRREGGREEKGEWGCSTL